MEDLKTRTKDKLEKPKLFKAILLNDDYTPMDFVIAVLMKIFKRSSQEAYDLTMETHNKGRAIAGIYSKDVAETMAMAAEKSARAYGYPFRLGIEPE